MNISAKLQCGAGKKVYVKGGIASEEVRSEQIELADKLETRGIFRKASSHGSPSVVGMAQVSGEVVVAVTTVIELALRVVLATTRGEVNVVGTVTVAMEVVFAGVVCAVELVGVAAMLGWIM